MKRLLAATLAAAFLWVPSLHAQEAQRVPAAGESPGSPWLVKLGFFWELDWTAPTVEPDPYVVSIWPSPRLGGVVSIGRWLGPRVSVQAEIELPQRRVLDVRMSEGGAIERRLTYRSDYFGASASFHPLSVPFGLGFSAGLGALRQTDRDTVSAYTRRLDWCAALSVGVEAGWRLRLPFDAVVGAQLLVPLDREACGGNVVFRPQASVRMNWRRSSPRSRMPSFTHPWFVEAGAFVPVRPVTFPDVGDHSSFLAVVTYSASSQYRPGLRLGAGRRLGERTALSVEFDRERSHFLTHRYESVTFGTVTEYHTVSRIDLLHALLNCYLPIGRMRLEFASGLGLGIQSGTADSLSPSDTTISEHRTSGLAGVGWSFPLGHRVEAVATVRLSVPLGTTSLYLRPGISLRWRF